MSMISGRARNAVGILTIGLFLFVALNTLEGQPLIAGTCLLLGGLRAVLLVRQWRWQKRRLNAGSDDRLDEPQ